MQQQTEFPTAATQSQGAGTGPGAEAITQTLANVEYGAFGAKPRECSAVVMLHISRDRIAIVATLDMGGLQAVTRTFTLDPKGGWRTHQPDFIAAEERIGVELAEYLDAMELPTRIAAMLPRPATNAGAAAMAEAAREAHHA